MAELVPRPFAVLLAHLLRQLERGDEVFHLPARRFFLGQPGRDLSVRFHDQVAGTALGPSAGPHSQLAQNIVLAFLGGGRIFELKTVQINDRLVIPRPCIDMKTVGYNVEWSQELTLEQSLEEYVKASMLIDILRASGALALAPGMDRVVYDLSVGYDLAGIQSERVRAFIDGMMDATAVVDRLRGEIPDAYRRYRDLDFTTRISSTLTLSTFHGCPPEEIEQMMAWLITEVGLDCIVKLNPTLLGPAEARALFNDRLGYPDHIPDEAFAKDTRWQQAVDFCGRLGEVAGAAGRGFGAKFTNTLIVDQTGDFFPASEKVMYLSGPPLHVLAMALVGRFRATFADRFPISFSAGIDRKNFADSVSLGLVPVTVCSDLLRTGGYARMQPYFTDLGARMDKVGARTIDEWVVLGQGQAEAALDRCQPTAAERAACAAALAAGGDLAAAAGEALWPRWVSAARLANTERYVAALPDDPRYAHAANRKPPPKVGSRLDLFDCLTCDKCVPVCPNDANFTYEVDATAVPVAVARPLGGGRFAWEQTGELALTKKHQIGNFADFCNECGNCDVFCPEDGGPYVLKPRFFGSHAQFVHHANRDGFYVDRAGGAERVFARFDGRDYALAVDPASGEATYSGAGFTLRCPGTPEDGLTGEADGEVDLTYFHIMDLVRRALLAAPHSYLDG